MNDKPFLETSVILYTFRCDDSLGAETELILTANGTTSPQVPNGFVAVARRKLKQPLEKFAALLR